MKKRTLITLSLLLLSIASFAQRDTIKDREVGLFFSSLNSFGLHFKCGNEKTLFRISAFTATGTNSASSYPSFSENGNTDTVPSSSSSSFNAGLNFGIEKRKRINDRFYCYYGVVLANSYTSSKANTTTPATYTNGYFVHTVYYAQTAVVNNTDQTNTWTINSGLGIVVGVAYNLSHSFSIGAELIPLVTYNYTETKNTASLYNVTWTVVPNAPSTLDEYVSNGSSEKITKGISYSVLNTNASITIAYRIK